MDISREDIYEELKRLTKEMFNNGWLWSGAAKLEKGNPYFAMVKHVCFYVKELDTWYCKETHVMFDFNYDEPINISEKERKLIPTSNLCNSPFIPGLSATDICLFADILRVGIKLKDSNGEE